jgi:cytochrome c oxidase assembly protein subunit 15
MVVIGGITRLTGSGLSITEWKPIMGAIPPMNEKEWQIAFEKYKEIPQFQEMNFHFTLHDFKRIFFWEYVHRLLGRLIGIVFIIPFLWFFIKRKFDRKTLSRVLFLFLLGGLQGFLGWFMVKSGLTDRTSVSHIRLAIHLITAFITFGFALYFALEQLDAGKQNSQSDKLISGNESRDVIGIIRILTAVVILQVIYGAFVAGMHAGKIFNTFPLMNDHFFPEGLFALHPLIENFYNNQITIQFIHRILAFLIVILSGYLFNKIRKVKIGEKGKNAIYFFLFMVIVQFLLGIFTLLTSVNITLAILHQAGAFFVFASCVNLLFIFSPGKKLII